MGEWLETMKSQESEIQMLDAIAEAVLRDRQLPQKLVSPIVLICQMPVENL